MNKKNHDTLPGNVLLLLIAAATVSLLIFFFSGAEWGEKETVTTTATIKKNTVQAQKNEPETVEATATGVYTVLSKKAVRTDKNGLKKDVPWVCPECGAPAEPNSLCDYCGEPYTRLWGYGFVRCWKTADGIKWELETAPECGCTPDEMCGFCRDKINHGWRSSGEVKYYEYSDFLKEKGLPMYEAVHPNKPVKKCKKQAVKKMEETVIIREVQEVKDVQDNDGQGVQQQGSGEEETDGETGELEVIDSCNSDDNGCGTADNLDNVTENLQEGK